MLLWFCLSALVYLLAFWFIARAGVRLMRRLGLDPVAVVLWLGLAEWPKDRPTVRRRPLPAAVLAPDLAAG